MKIKIGKLFELLNEFGKTDVFSIRDENNNLVPVIQKIKKIDNIYDVKLSNGNSFKCGEHHKIISGGVQVLLKDAENVDLIDGTNVKIIAKELLSKDGFVYDFEVDSESHLYSLPDGSIHHNTEFTSHTRDVLDIIPSGGNFTQTFEYIKNKEDLAAISERMGFELHSVVGNIMGQLALEFKSTKDSDDNPIEDPDIQPFWWNDGSSVFYVSPREMTECVANTITQIEDSFDDMGWDIDGTYSDEDYEAYIDEAINVTAKSFVNTFNMITLKQDVQGFTKLLGMKILGNEKFRKMFESIRTKKSANQLNLVQILKNVNGDVSFLDKGVIGEYIKDFSSTEMIQDVSNITDEYFQNTNGMEALENTLALFDRLTKSLERLNVSNNYTDQLKKYIGGKVASLITSPKIDILEIADNNQMVSRIEKLTPVTD